MFAPVLDTASQRYKERQREIYKERRMFCFTPGHSLPEIQKKTERYIQRERKCSAPVLDTASRRYKERQREIYKERGNVLLLSQTQQAGDTKKDRERYTKREEMFCSSPRHM